MGRVCPDTAAAAVAIATAIRGSHECQEDQEWCECSQGYYKGWLGWEEFGLPFGFFHFWCSGRRQVYGLFIFNCILLFDFDVLLIHFLGCQTDCYLSFLLAFMLCLVVYTWAFTLIAVWLLFTLVVFLILIFFWYNFSITKHSVV